MIFIVRRTSACVEQRPCKEAKMQSFVYVDRRTVKTLEAAKQPKYAHWAKAFFASGTNHREEYGMIARDLDEEDVWTIEIKSLDKLLDFIDKYGDVVIYHEDSYKGIDKGIKIY